MSGGIRPASTVIVARPLQQMLGSFDYSILMVKRARSVGFFPNAHVFPGGVQDEIDRDHRWKGLMMKQWSSQLDYNIDMTQGSAPARKPVSPAPAASPSSPRKPASPIPDSIQEFSFRITAMRELFEEANVLLGTDKESITPSMQKQLQHWRPIVQKDGNQFLDMFLSMGLTPNPQLIFPWSHWITPVNEPRRYNTLFYLSVVNQSLSSDAIEDKTESVTLDWFTPKEALDAFESGKIFLPPPTWVMLHELSVYPTLQQLVKEAKNRSFGKNVLPIMPRFSPWEDGKTSPFPLPANRKLVAVGKVDERLGWGVTSDSSDTSPSTWRYFFTPETATPVNTTNSSSMQTTHNSSSSSSSDFSFSSNFPAQPRGKL